MSDIINKEKDKSLPSATNLQIVPLAISPICSAKDKIAEFVLELYHGGLFQEDRLILKSVVRKKFIEFVAANDYKGYFSSVSNIGTLLRHSRFLQDTPRQSFFYCLQLDNVFKFVKEKLDFLYKDFAGCFLLNLLHQTKIQRNGNILKSTIEIELQQFTEKYEKLNEFFGQVLIGTLLRENNFLNNTPKGSLYYCVGMKKLFEFRNEKIKQLDEMRKNGFSANSNLTGLKEQELTEKQFEEVSESAEKFPVVFQGGSKQSVDKDFVLTSLGCFICQKNFATQSQLESHIISHGLESDFEFLSEDHKTMENMFEINYHLCEKSHFFCFTMKTRRKDVIIKKIIIVQSRRMQFIKNNLVPYEMPIDGRSSFLVDSHLFTLGVEQPIVVVYSYKSDDSVRYFEQHHFLRLEEFPKVHFPIRSYRLSSSKLLENKNAIKTEYRASKMLQLSQKNNFSDESLGNASKKFGEYIANGSVLNSENMCEALKVMIHIEDLETTEAYRPLYQRAAKIKKFGNQYTVRLQLPKNVFLENVVTPLDEIILIPTKCEPGRKKKIYTAVIERVYYNQVCFEYKHRGVGISDKELYEVILRPSRLSLKYQMRALDLLSYNSRMRNYLFPTIERILPVTLSTEKLDLFNTSIENNLEQLEAVRNIACGPDVPAPYVLFGPPGTGKTSTIVETVLQLWKRRPETRILISSGSNSACDEVAVRLCREFVNLCPEKPNILRIFARSNEKRLDSIDDVLIQSSNFYGAHFYPCLEAIYQYRIIVCTLSVAGRLVSAPISDSFFTHIFIDECGASTEAETLAGWMGTSSKKTRLIVSGDPKQLGPVLKSSKAASLGLKISFMERLMSSDCYAVDSGGQYNRSIQTRLIRNYRSHPEIVELYNKLYYNNELKSLAPKDETDWAMKWHLLPTQKCPIVFHSVYGYSSKCGSLSLSNELEISVVMEYVKDLMYFGINGRKITEADIGIISPYKKQYTLIQEELNLRRWNQIEVGAVESFQGREKFIIIVSTVRSFTKSLGFLDCPRRLNVILSRPKALLIMIGNPKTLSQNKDFKFIIDECRRKKSTVGSFRGYAEEETDKLIGSMKKLKLKNPPKKLNCGNLKSKQKHCNKHLEKSAISFIDSKSKLEECERTEDKADKSNATVSPFLKPNVKQCETTMDKVATRIRYLKSKYEQCDGNLNEYEPLSVGNLKVLVEEHERNASMLLGSKSPSKTGFLKPNVKQCETTMDKVAMRIRDLKSKYEQCDGNLNEYEPLSVGNLKVLVEKYERNAAMLLGSKSPPKTGLNKKICNEHAELDAKPYEVKKGIKSCKVS